MSSLQSEVIEQQSNSFSSPPFFPQFIHRQSIKNASSGPAIPIRQKISELNNELISSIQIISPCRLKANKFRAPLHNYQYQRIQRKIEAEVQKHGKLEQEQLKEQQRLILILIAVMREFRGNLDKAFYIINRKCNRVLYFYHLLDTDGNYVESRLKISNMGEKMGSYFEIQRLFAKVSIQDGCQKIIITNQAINIFWANLINQIISYDKYYKSFTLLTNYSFPYCSQVDPIQIFNGIENKKQFSYIGKSKTTLTGDTIEEVYRMKIIGLWNVENVRKLVEELVDAYGEKGFDLEIQVEKVTKGLGKLEDQE